MIEILLQTADGVELQELKGKRLYRIGRHANCEIRIKNDLAISRFHAAIYLDEEEKPIITDGDLNTGKASTFGTQVNGVKLVSEYGQKLNDGDEVVLSHATSFKFFIRNLIDNGDEQSTVL